LENDRGILQRVNDSFILNYSCNSPLKIPPLKISKNQNFIERQPTALFDSVGNRALCLREQAFLARISCPCGISLLAKTKIRFMPTVVDKVLGWKKLLLSLKKIDGFVED